MNSQRKGQNEFDIFAATPEGDGAPRDTVSETYRKFIEHIQFMKEFTILYNDYTITLH